MERMRNYVARQETMVFLPRFDQFGNLSTVVLESELECHLDMDPKALMDHCLRYYGSSLRGARDGARMILGNIKMCPVLMNEKLELYWFSTKSSEKKDCVWFALNHVKDYESEGVKETKVTLSNGIMVIVDVSLYTFKKKIQRAYQLKGKLDERSKLNLLSVMETKSGYQIWKATGGLNYEMDRE